ncbi:MAG: divalent cation tolerance protein CutA [Candidatus Thalassarchaeaceae archaeon]|nr:divalent cation tolerance protein CutA [Candidatus Thalassarchaeaceae archaeon]
MPPQISIVQTTLPTSWIEPEVGSFSQLMIESGAACVQYSKTRSTYKWEGQIESSEEWKLQIKVQQNGLETLLTTLRKNHPHTLPQIVHWLAESTAQYTDWVESA